MADKKYRLNFGMSDGSTKSVEFSVPQAEGGGSSSQPDWKDITNKPFGDMEVVILEEQTFTPDTENGNAFTASVVPAVGDTVIVTYDGVTYDCEVVEMSGLPVAGNMAAFGGDDTGEPFFIGWLNATTTVVFASDPADHTISIRGVLSVKIPEKYIAPPYTTFYVTFINSEGYPYITEDVTLMYQISKEKFLEAMRRGLVFLEDPETQVRCLVTTIIPHTDSGAYAAACFLGSDGYIFYTYEYTA